MLTVIGSLAEIVAVAELAPFFSDNWDDSVEVIVPRVTVKPSEVSDRSSSVAPMVIVSVAPAAELAANVTVPEVADKSEPLAPSVLSGADQATTTSAATAFDSVTVNDAFPRSATFDAGPLIDISAVSLSPGGVVVLSSSVNVTVAEVTDSPETVVVPGMMIASSPSTTVSSVGVIVRVPLPLALPDGIVTEARDVAE